MGIGSYKEAERYRMRTNKNLTRTFYLDTRRTLDEEPFAWEQPQVASIEQPETVQGFAKGGIVSNQEKLEKLKQIVLESNSNPFKSISKNQAVLSAGYKKKWHITYGFYLDIAIYKKYITHNILLTAKRKR